MSGRKVGIISPPWLTASGEPEIIQVDIDGEGAAARLADAADMPIEDAEAYLEAIAIGRAEYEASLQFGDIGHA